MTDREPTDRHLPDDEAVENLLRLAGRRTPPPPERAARVKSAVRASWDAAVTLRASRRRRALLLAAAAVLLPAVALVLLQWPGEVAPTEVGRIASLSRSVWLQTVGEVRAVAPSPAGVVAAGDRMRTGADGRVAVRLDSGRSIRLDHETSIRIVSEGLLELEQGAVYVDSGTDTVGSIEIRTPLGVVRDVGTQFEVRLTPESVRVRVREGIVTLQAEDRVHRVEAGGEIRLDIGGVVERASIASHGVDWEWVASVTPMPDLEGLNARAFLDWIARERGWQLQFADVAVAASAGDTTVRGSLQGLGLDDALDVVLPACGLDYRVVDGRLIIDAVDSSGG